MNTVEFGPWLFAMSGRSQRVGRQPGHGERHLHQAPPDPIRRRRHPHRRRCKPRVHDRLLVRQRRATLQRPPDQHSRRYRAGDSHDGWCAVRRNRRGCYPCPCCSLSSPSYCIGIEHEGGAIADAGVIAALLGSLLIDHDQNSIPGCAFTPTAKWCFTTIISVTRSAASISAGRAFRPVTTTCRSGLRSRSAAMTSASDRYS
jgi:hypothetical protein